MDELRLMGMQTENFCRVKLVRIAPDGKTVEICGKNAQGKTSEVNSFWAAIGGPRALAEMDITNPVRQGEEEANIYVDLGDLLVWREFAKDGSTKVKVTSKEGFKMEPGQTVLDSLRSKFFDLSAFIRMDGPSKKKMLESMVPLSIDLAKWATDRKAVYEKRTTVNAEVTRLTKLLESIPAVEAPEEEVSAASIIAEMEKAQEAKDANDAQRQALVTYSQEYVTKQGHLDYLKKEHGSYSTSIEDLKQQIARIEKKQAETETEAATLIAVMEDMKVKGNQMRIERDALVDPDMTAFSARLSEVEETNRLVRASKSRANTKAELEMRKAASNQLTVQLDAMDVEKDVALSQAEFPVDGLSFDTDGVTFNGQPIGQASDAENLFIGYGIGKALNPKLKVMRLSRPNDLDEDNYGALLERAEADGYQLLIEMVGSGESGVEIVDGCADSGTTPGVEKIIAEKPKKRAAKVDERMDPNGDG